jgi:hypothetical protein
MLGEAASGLRSLGRYKQGRASLNRGPRRWKRASQWLPSQQQTLQSWGKWATAGKERELAFATPRCSASPESDGKSLNEDRHKATVIVLHDEDRYRQLWYFSAQSRRLRSVEASPRSKPVQQHPPCSANDAARVSRVLLRLCVCRRTRSQLLLYEPAISRKT